MKHDLEVALKEVLHAVRAKDGTSSMAISNLNLENLAHVSVLFAKYIDQTSSFQIYIFYPAYVLFPDITDY